MATGDGVTEWIDVADFTPGIHSGTRSFATGTPESATDGVAQVRDTWGCVANPNGGLEAAPLLAYEHEDSLQFPYDEEKVILATAPIGSRILDFAVAQQTFHEDYVADARGEITNPPDAVAVLHQQFYVDDGTPYVAAASKVYSLNDGSSIQNRAVQFIRNTGISAETWGVGNITFVRYAIDAAGNFAIDNSPHPFITFYFNYRSALDSGAPANGRVGWIGMPNATPYLGEVIPVTEAGGPAGPGDDPLWGWSGLPEGDAFRVAYHQGRLVYSTATSQMNLFGRPYRDQYRPLAQLDDLYSDERLRYLGVLQPDPLTYTPNENLILVETGRPDMIGVMASVNTTELYVVKASGGGVIVSGSLERPTVSRYPGVESTGAYPHKSVLVPTLGLVYGGVGGVFAWNGGNQSQQLSQSIDGSFWLTPENRDRSRSTDDDDSRPRHPHTGCGKFAYLFPYVYAPNNWIMDVRTGGWFRLHPTREQNPEIGHDLAYFDVSSTGRVYAAPDIQKPDDPIAWVRFAPKSGAPKFSWRSQPIARQLRGRQLEFKELNAVVSGKGTITVSLVGIDGTTQSKVIEVNADRPTLVVKKYDMRAFDIEVLIQSEGAFIPEVTAVGTLKLESAADVGGGYRSGALASDPVVPGLKVAAPQRFDTGVTFTGTSFPAAQTLPDDDASGWTSFGAGQNLSFQLQTPNAGIPAGTISCWIIRYDLQTAAGEHVGYLYKQAYYTSTMTEVGTNSHSIHVWYRSSGTELLTGPQTQSSLRTWAMDRIVDSEIREAAPTMHRFSLGYKQTSVANRN